MRDENGTFIGNTDCIYWNGVASIVDKKCCGGRVSKYANVNCAERGEVLAVAICVSACCKAKMREV